MIKSHSHDHLIISEYLNPNVGGDLKKHFKKTKIYSEKLLKIKINNQFHTHYLNNTIILQNKYT